MNRIPRFTLAFMLTAAVASVPLQAGVWNGSVSNDWENASNWTGALPSGTEVAEFYASSAANFSTISLTATAGNHIADRVIFNTNASSSVTIAGDASNVLRLDSIGTTADPVVLVETGSHRITNLGWNTTSSNAFGVFTVNGVNTALTVDDFINGASNNRGIQKEGAGTLTLKGSSSGYASGLVINDGTIDLQTNTSSTMGRLSGTGGLLTNSSATLATVTVLGTSASPTPSTQTFSGNISGNLELVKGRTNFNDSNPLFLEGVNTYTGATTVNTGTLAVNGTHTGGGSYTVKGSNTSSRAGNANLTGTGTITLADTGTLSLQGFDFTGTDSVAVLAPGAIGTIGTLTIRAESTTFDNISRFLVEIGAAGSSDRLDLQSTVDLASDLILNAGSELFIDADAIAGAFDGSNYTILTFDGTRTGKFATVTLLDGAATDITATAETGFTVNGNPYKLVYDGTINGSIDLILVPEPASLVLAAAGGLLMLPRRRPR